MTDMTHEQIRDALPDVVHSTIDRDRRLLIEDHLRACAECASEMRVLQMVKDAPSFVPMIDAVKVSSNILPYGGIPAERPRSRTRVWQTLAAVAAVVIVAVTLMSRGANEISAPAAPSSQVAVSPSVAVPPVDVTARTDSPARSAVTAAPKAHELQVAVGLDDLSDRSVAQLASDLGALDGLPSAEPENLGVADPGAGTGGE
jgi:anti-sigma factor RsiW